MKTSNKTPEKLTMEPSRFSGDDMSLKQEMCLPECHDSTKCTEIHSIFPTDWRDAPECVWLHPHWRPSGVQAPAPLGHVSSTGDVGTPGRPATCRDWWVAEWAGRDQLPWANYLVKMGKKCVIYWLLFFATQTAVQIRFLFSSSVFVCYISGEEFVVSSLFHSPEAGGIPPELSCFLNRCFIARVRCLLDSTSGFLVSGPNQTASSTEW